MPFTRLVCSSIKIRAELLADRGVYWNPPEDDDPFYEEEVCMLEAPVD
jgi:hypothetical protein